MSDPSSSETLPKPSQLKAYADAGWKFVLLHHYQATKTLANGKVLKLGKAPIGKKWVENGVDSKTARVHMNSGKNTGALIPHGWAVVDVDPRNFPEGRDVFHEFCRGLGFESSLYPFVKTGSGGYHFFVRIPDTFKGVVKHPDYPGIEFKQYGAQVVTAGSVHPDTARYYTWEESPVTMAQAPMVPETVLTLYQMQLPALSKDGRSASTWNSFTLEQVDEALALLDVTEYRQQDEWFGLMCSVHWLSGGDARELWIEWSTGDVTYETHREIIEMRWDSLDRDATTDQVTAKGGQLFKALQRKGVSPADGRWQIAAEKDFLDYDGEELEQDSQKITNDRQAVEDKIQKTAGSLIVSMNERHFVLNHKGKTVIGEKRFEEDDHGAQTSIYVFSDPSSFKSFYANRQIKTPDGMIPISEWWMHHPQRLTYNKMEFRPDRPAGSYRSDIEGLVLNQWTGWAIRPKAGEWNYFKELIEDVVCHGDSIKYEYLYNWFAYAYQKLNAPIGTAVAINGLKGTGKSTIWEVFSTPFGSNHAMATSRMDEIFGQFNGRMMGKAALLIEEALFAGSRQADNILKDMVTGQRLSINEKFLPAYSQKNFSRIMIFTNSDHIVQATEDERRYFVTKIKPTKKGDKKFWDALRQQMFHDGGVAAFFNDMLHRDITGFDPYHDLPRTRELIEQINITRGPILDWLSDKIDFGDGHFEYTWETPKREFVIPIHEFCQDFLAWQKNQSHGRYDQPIKSQSQFTREMKRLFEGTEQTTGSVPDDMAFEIRGQTKDYQSRAGMRKYLIARVYRFDSYAAFVDTFRRKYGIDALELNPNDFDDEEPDFSLPYEQDWNIL